MHSLIHSTSGSAARTKLPTDAALMVNKLGKPHAGYAHEGARPIDELFVEGAAIHPLDVHPAQRASDRVIACGVDDDVQLIVGVGGLNAVLRDALDRGLLNVHQQHVVLVVDLVVAALAGQALGAEHVVLGGQHLRHHRVLHPLAYLVAEELGVVLIGRTGHHHVIEVAEPLLEAGLLPQGFVELHPLFFRNAEGGAGVELVHEGAGGLQALLEYLWVARPDFLLLFRRDLAVAQGSAVVGGALEDGQVADLPGDFRDELHCRGPGADHADALAG